jgi:sugar phosphate isomerase/epimerase
MTFRYAICNETFEGWDHPRVCRTVAELGYHGLEIAPFTLASRITDVSAEQRQTLRRQAEDAGVEIIGLHWLLAKTEGLQLTSPDAAVGGGAGGLEPAHCRLPGGTGTVLPGSRR